MRRAILLLPLFFLCTLPALAQERDRTVRGTVTDGENGRPLAGATVVVAGTQIGTATSARGTYSLRVPSSADSLRFSFVGYQTQTVALGNKRVINVTLQPDFRELDQIVKVGYGEQEQRSITGSIAQVSAQDIQNQPVNSFEEALQGQVAGVTITNGNGKLGQGIQVRIRGASSISASNEPLYVVDGIPLTTPNLSGNDAPTNPLAQLNVSDIKSIEILKDASAAAIYGARASNGVVLITTKSGVAGGGSEVTVNIQRTVSSPTNTVDMMNAQEYVSFYQEAAINRAEDEFAAGAFASREAAIAYWKDFVLETFYFDFFARGTNWREQQVDANWQDQAFRDDAGGFQADISARGGDADTRFYLSGTYNIQDGILIRDNYDKIAGRVNVDHTFNDRFNVGGKLSLTRVKHTRLPDDNQFSTPMQLIAQMPISPIYQPQTEGIATGPNGYLQQYVPTDDLNTETLYFNNLLYQGNVRYDTRIFRSIGSAFAEYSFLPTLKLRGQFGIDVLDQNEDQYFNSQVADNTGAARGLGVNAWDRVVNYNANAFLTYDRAFNGVHDVKGTVGTSIQAVQQDGSFVQGEQFPNDSFGQVNSAAEITGGGAYETGYSFLAYFARANYGYDDRYFLTLSGRYEGSSRFGANNRFGFFPAVSGGWVVSQESFFDVGAINYLKLRASYGLTGNASIGNFLTQALWGGLGYSGIPGTQPVQTPNPDLKWEQTAQLNTGINLGLFNDRITLEADYYRKETRDLLLGVNVPGTSGFLSRTVNLGNLQNWGIEALVETQNVQSSSFNWTSSINFALNRNKITDINGQVIEGGFVNRAVEGEPIGVFYTYEYAGVDPQTGDALYYVNERNANGDIVNPEATTTNPNEANRVVVGSPHPDFTGGVGNELSYKGFSLSFLFQFEYGKQVFDGGGTFKTSNARFLDNQLATQLDAWQEPGDQTDVPEARLFVNNGGTESSRFLYDASYLRLKNVTFAYNVPSRFLESVGLSRARVYVTGINLLTFTKYPWWDPEVNADFAAGNIGLGNEFYSAPQARSISGGLQFSF